MSIAFHPLAAALPRHAHHLEVLRPGTEPHAEAEAVVGEERDRARLLRHEHRRTDGKLEHERCEADPARHRSHGGNEGERLDELLVLEKLAIPSSVYG